MVENRLEEAGSIFSYDSAHHTHTYLKPICVPMNVSQNFLVKEVTGCGASSPYKQPFVGMLVPFGAGEGVGMFNGFHIPSFVGTKLKYADLFTGQFWKTAGLKVPQ